jgi:hypothetical protein
MSTLDDLRGDLSRNRQPASMAGLPVDVREWAKDTLWPFLETMLDLHGEHLDAIDEIIEQTEDFLQAETAQEIGKPIGIGFALADELERRAGGDPGVKKMVAEFRAAAQAALAIIREIAIPEDGDADADSGAGSDLEDEDEDEDDEHEEVTP